MLNKAILDLKNGLQLYYVWSHQAYHDITAKYKRTVLGSLWLAGSMVITSVSLAVLFGALFHQSIQVSLPYTMSGILGFSMVAYIFYEGGEMFLTSGGIIKNHAYPFTFYAFYTVCKNFFLFLHNILVYWIVVALVGAFAFPNWTLFFALPVVLIFMFTWGTLGAMLATRFRDMRFLLPYLGQLFSFLTPIFWRPDGLKGVLLMVVNLNPIYALIQIVRAPLLGQYASAFAWEASLSYTGLGMILWLISFSAFRRRIPFWV